VIDDGSTDRTEEIVRGLPCQYIKIEKSGVARARNVGIANASGEILLFFDADTILTKNTITMFLEVFNNDHELCIAQGRWVQDCPSANFNTQFHLNKWSYNFKKLLSGQKRMAVSELMTGCLGVRKEVFQKIGSFDENYKRSGGEEWELGFRMLKNNYKIYYYDSIAVHHEFGSFLSTLYKTYYRTINFAMLILDLKNEKKAMLEGVKNSVPKRDKLSMIYVSLIVGAIIYGLYYVSPLAPSTPVPHSQAGALTGLFFCGLYLLNIKSLLFFHYERAGVLFSLRALFADWLIISQKILATLSAVLIYYMLRQKKYKI
jgi:glycosyltransferase involved in cell wall biosynthesis